MQGAGAGGAEGRLDGLARWPVKSFAGERLAAAAVDERGLAGDRTFFLLDPGYPLASLDTGYRLAGRITARQAPRTLLWSAGYPDHPDDALAVDDPPPPVVVAPDGRRLSWDDPELPALLAADLGLPVRQHRDVRGQQDVGQTVLVTVEASRAALEREWGHRVDLRRFRPNLHVTLDAPAFAEAAWPGGRLVVGDCEFDLVRPCRRCIMIDREPDTATREATLRRLVFDAHEGFFGIYGRARRPGRVAVGDRVRFVPGPSA